MAKLLQLQTIVSLLMLMLANYKLVHSQTSFTFNYFSQNPTDLTYQGDAHVPSEVGFVRLTKTDAAGVPGLKSVGRVLYSAPIQLWGGSSGGKASFESNITFVVRKSSGGGADGLAFFMAPVGTTIPTGSDSGNLGIFDSSGTSESLFAVEFDTWSNEWDPGYEHIGIDLNSRLSYNTTKYQIATVAAYEVNVSVKYDAATGRIDVAANSECGSRTAQLSYIFDLSKILPEQVQVGFTSSTGAPIENNGVHDIRFWSFDSTLATNHELEAYGDGAGKYNF